MDWLESREDLLVPESREEEDREEESVQECGWKLGNRRTGSVSADWEVRIRKEELIPITNQERTRYCIAGKTYFRKKDHWKSYIIQLKNNSIKLFVYRKGSQFGIGDVKKMENKMQHRVSLMDKPMKLIIWSLSSNHLLESWKIRLK